MKKLPEMSEQGQKFSIYRGRGGVPKDIGKAVSLKEAACLPVLSVLSSETAASLNPKASDELVRYLPRLKKLAY